MLVALEGLGMQGTSCLEALRLSFQVACLRCTKSTGVTFSSVEVSQVLATLDAGQWLFCLDADMYTQQVRMFCADN